MHIHAVSVSDANCPPQFGVCHSAGHPDHADGLIVGKPGPAGPGSTKTTPSGSPGFTFGGPTVPGAAVTGSFPFGISGSGGRIARVNKRAID